MTSIRERSGLDVAALRAHFPSLARVIDGRPVAYLDGPGGTQVPRECIDAIVSYLESSNANHGGAFVAAVESDAVLDEVHAAAADFLGAHDPAEIAFGPNMTTLTFAVSRAIGRELAPGDEVVVTRLDHDANVAPWLALAEERGLVIRWLELDESGARLDLDGLDAVLGPRTKVVAVGLASNALGTLTDVGRVIEAAHTVGALTTSTPCMPDRTCRSTWPRSAPTCSCAAPTSSSVRTSACSTAVATCSSGCQPSVSARRGRHCPGSGRPAPRATRRSPGCWAPSAISSVWAPRTAVLPVPRIVERDSGRP
jgi:hypothetical protein